MIQKLSSNPSKIPSPRTDEIMKMCKSTWNETVSKVDIYATVKRNAITIKLDGLEDYLVSSRLKALVWEEMKEFHSKLLSNPNPASLKKLEEVMIPSDDVKHILKKVVDGTPPDEGLEIISGELTDEERDDMEIEQEENNLDENGSGNMNVVDDVEEHETVDETDAAASSFVQKSKKASLEPKIKAHLECLNRLGCVADTGKKEKPVELLPFLVKVENVFAKERQPCKARAKAKKSKANMTN